MLKEKEICAGFVSAKLMGTVSAKCLVKVEKELNLWIGKTSTHRVQYQPRFPASTKGSGAYSLWVRRDECAKKTHQCSDWFAVRPRHIFFFFFLRYFCVQPWLSPTAEDPGPEVSTGEPLSQG